MSAWIKQNWFMDKQTFSMSTIPYNIYMVVMMMSHSQLSLATFPPLRTYQRDVSINTIYDIQYQLMLFSVGAIGCFDHWDPLDALCQYFTKTGAHSQSAFDRVLCSQFCRVSVDQTNFLHLYVLFSGSQSARGCAHKALNTCSNYGWPF